MLIRHEQAGCGELQEVQDPATRRRSLTLATGTSKPAREGMTADLTAGETDNSTIYG